MFIKKNEKKTKEKFLNGELSELICIPPNIADGIISYADETLKLDNMINDVLKIKRHSDAEKSEVFIYALITAKLKRLFSITESVVAITAPKIIEKFNLNILNKKEIMTEGNMRNFISDVSKTSDKISDETVNKILEENIKKNKKIKDEDKKKIEDINEIRENEQIKLNGSIFINFFNEMSKKIINTIHRPKIHILDCVKIPVNPKNKNYELSTVINYEGKTMRGYKLGVLRGVTAQGGIIELLIDGTISDNDMSLTEEPITNYGGFKEGDYLLADRGFAKIDFIKGLVKKGVNVIMPVKKNMDIFLEAVRIAKQSNENEWKEHPNSKREGQKILLVKDLKGTWLDEKEKDKKPSKYMETALDFSACVIRIEKEKNKDIIKSSKKSEDDTDVMYEDEKYIYIVITSTNTDLTASQIIKYYELRPEIEEDFRQLKDIWKMCTFTSTKYFMVMCHLAMTFLAYNLFNIYKCSEEGKKYANKSMKKIANEEHREMYPFEEVSYIIICGKSYCMIDGVELLDLYADCDKPARNKIRSLLKRGY